MSQQPMPKSSSKAPIDLVGLRDNIGDIDLEPLLKIFVEDAACEIDKIKTALDGANAHQVMMLAHGLKGACATMHITQMRDACLKIENTAKKNDLAPVTGLLKTLHNELKAVKDYGRTLK